MMVGVLLGVLAGLFVFLCAFIILIVLIQKPQGGGLAGAFGGAGGGSEAVFGGRTGDVLTWFTVVAFGLFLILGMALVYATRDVTEVLQVSFRATPPRVAADGEEKAKLTVRVRDEDDNPMPGASVQLKAQGKGFQGTFTKKSGTTGQNGKFESAVTSTSAGRVTVTASVDGGSSTATTPVTFGQPGASGGPPSPPSGGVMPQQPPQGSGDSGGGSPQDGGSSQEGGASQESGSGQESGGESGSSEKSGSSQGSSAGEGSGGKASGSGS